MNPTAESNVATGEAYYQAFFGDKDPDRLARYLDPDVQFIGPLAELSGRAAVIEGARRLMSQVDSYHIRGRFGAGDQVMLAYDLQCAAPIGLLRTAALMTFRQGLIARIELFFDARPFDKHGR
jgi:hypothetical protein